MGYMGANSIVDDLGENVSGALAYSLGFVTGVVFYFLAERNRFVRFHAVQSVILFGGFAVLYFAFSTVVSVVLFLPVLGPALVRISWFAFRLLGLVALALWILLMLKAYQGDRFELPVVGQLAANYARQ